MCMNYGAAPQFRVIPNFADPVFSVYSRVTLFPEKKFTNSWFSFHSEKKVSTVRAKNARINNEARTAHARKVWWQVKMHYLRKWGRRFGFVLIRIDLSVSDFKINSRLKHPCSTPDILLLISTFVIDKLLRVCSLWKLENRHWVIRPAKTGSVIIHQELTSWWYQKLITCTSNLK